MDAIGGGLWNWNPLPFRARQRPRRNQSNSDSFGSVESAGGTGYKFPLKQAVTAASLALAGDTIAQLRDSWKKAEATKQSSISDSGGFSQVRKEVPTFWFIASNNSEYIRA